MKKKSCKTKPYVTNTIWARENVGISIFSVACVQTSPISFHPQKRDICETASLMVFQYPAVFLTIATVRNNSDWLSSGNARDNVCDLHLAGFSIDKNMSACVLCFSTILKNNDRNLVKSRSEFKVQEEILSLQFIVHETSPYICRSCMGKLRKRRGLYANVRKIEDELFSDYSSKAFKAGLTVKKKKDRDTRKGQRRNFSFSREATSFGGVGRSFVERSQFAGYVNSCESRSQCFCEKNSDSSS